MYPMMDKVINITKKTTEIGIKNDRKLSDCLAEKLLKWLVFPDNRTDSIQTVIIITDIILPQMYWYVH